MTFDFLKRKPERPSAKPRSMGLPDPGILTEEPPAEDYELKLTYRARSSKGVRFRPGEGSVAALPLMLEQFAKSPIELIEPLDPQFADANPTVMRTIEASQWLNAHHLRSPVTRYGLMVLESLDAVDPAYESIAMCLLEGQARFGGLSRLHRHRGCRGLLLGRGHGRPDGPGHRGLGWSGRAR